MKITSRCRYWYFLVFTLYIYPSTSFAESGFPGRAHYPTVPVIELNKLAAKFDDYRIVDVRSPYEFKIMHIQGAINIPFSSTSFIKEVRKIRDTSAAPIIIYCNGSTCMKSYKAVKISIKNKISNILAYDDGILDWAQAFPDKTVLFDKNPIDTANLIADKDFEKHLLDPEKFELDVAEHEPIVLDIRDRDQRESLSLFVDVETHVNIDDHAVITQFIKQANSEKKPLYIYDTAGKRTRWLQYLLEENNAQAYYFMKGGTYEYFKKMREKYTSAKQMAF